MSEPAKKITRPEPVKTVPEPVKPVPASEPPKTSVVPPKQTARALRRKRVRRLVLRLAAFVVLPTLIAAVYYGLIVTRQYESIAEFTVQSADGGGAPSLEFLLATVPGSGPGRDSLIIKNYIHSRDMLRVLVNEHGFVEHYSSPNVDRFSRLAPDASFEGIFDYYGDKVTTDHDSGSGVITVRVRAFSSAKAHELAEAIIAESERMVNRMMDQARTDKIDLARAELDRAEQRLTAARAQLVQLQGERAELDPRASAEAILEVRGELEARLSEARAELSAIQSTLQPGTPQLVAQQQRVAALTRQVHEQTERLAANDREDGLNADIAAFEPAVVEKEFAQHAYTSALKSLEIAQLEAGRQHRYLVEVSRPSEPDEATLPNVWMSVLTVLVLSFAFLGIGTLLLASVREHANL